MVLNRAAGWPEVAARGGPYFNWPPPALQQPQQAFAGLRRLSPPLPSPPLSLSLFLSFSLPLLASPIVGAWPPSSLQRLLLLLLPPPPSLFLALFPSPASPCRCFVSNVGTVPVSYLYNLALPELGSLGQFC